MSKDPSSVELRVSELEARIEELEADLRRAEVFYDQIQAACRNARLARAALDPDFSRLPEDAKQGEA